MSTVLGFYSQSSSNRQQRFATMHGGQRHGSGVFVLSGYGWVTSSWLVGGFPLAIQVPTAGMRFRRFCKEGMVGTGRFELPTPRTPSEFRTIHADCYCLLNFTTVISIRASRNLAELLLIYAILYPGSPQCSRPKTGDLLHRISCRARLRALQSCNFWCCSRQILSRSFFRASRNSCCSCFSRFLSSLRFWTLAGLFNSSRLRWAAMRAS
jgi:hypothetical protein